MVLTKAVLMSAFWKHTPMHGLPFAEHHHFKGPVGGAAEERKEPGSKQLAAKIVHSLSS